MRARCKIAMLAALAVLAIAGCGGDDEETTTAAGETAQEPAASSSGGSSGGGSSDGEAAVGTDSDALPGATILVDGQGMSLYMFEKDSGGESSCFDACARDWPPLIATGESMGTGDVDASMLGTTKRPGGVEQVTYADFPLYTYGGDSAPGDVSGNDVDAYGAEWYALQPSGEPTEDSGSESAGESTDDSTGTMEEESSGGSYGGY